MKGFAVTVTPARRRALLAQAPETPLVPPLGGPGAAAAEARRLPSSYTWAVSFTVQTGLVASGHASAAGLASSIASSLTSGLAAAVQTDLGLAVTVAQVDTAVENTRAPTKEPTAGPAAPTGSTAGGASADAGEGADEGGGAKGGSSDEGVPVFLIGIIGGGALGLCLASAVVAFFKKRTAGKTSASAQGGGADPGASPEEPAASGTKWANPDKPGSRDRESSGESARSSGSAASGEVVTMESLEEQAGGTSRVSSTVLTGDSSNFSSALGTSMDDVTSLEEGSPGSGDGGGGGGGHGRLKSRGLSPSNRATTSLRKVPPPNQRQDQNNGRKLLIHRSRDSKGKDSKGKFSKEKSTRI